jgi:hypothetical protein
VGFFRALYAQLNIVVASPGGVEEERRMGWMIGPYTDGFITELVNFGDRLWLYK